jgi:hypothetical protein
MSDDKCVLELLAHLTRASRDAAMPQHLTLLVDSFGEVLSRLTPHMTPPLAEKVAAGVRFLLLHAEPLVRGALLFSFTSPRRLHSLSSQLSLDTRDAFVRLIIDVVHDDEEQTNRLCAVRVLEVLSFQLLKLDRGEPMVVCVFRHVTKELALLLTLGPTTTTIESSIERQRVMHEYGNEAEKVAFLHHLSQLLASKLPDIVEQEDLLVVLLREGLRRPNTDAVVLPIVRLMYDRLRHMRVEESTQALIRKFIESENAQIRTLVIQLLQAWGEQHKGKSVRDRIASRKAHRAGMSKLKGFVPTHLSALAEMLEEEEDSDDSDDFEEDEDDADESDDEDGSNASDVGDVDATGRSRPSSSSSSSKSSSPSSSRPSSSSLASSSAIPSASIVEEGDESSNHADGDAGKGKRTGDKTNAKKGVDTAGGAPDAKGDQSKPGGDDASKDAPSTAASSKLKAGKTDKARAGDEWAAKGDDDSDNGDSRVGAKTKDGKPLSKEALAAVKKEEKAERKRQRAVKRQEARDVKERARKERETAELELLKRDRRERSWQLRRALRVPDTYTTLQHMTENTERIIYRGLNTDLPQTGHIYAALPMPNFSLDNNSAELPSSLAIPPSAVLTLIRPAFEGVPDTATTIPPVFMESGANAARSNLDIERETEARTLGVPDGFVVAKDFSVRDHLRRVRDTDAGVDTADKPESPFGGMSFATAGQFGVMARRAFGKARETKENAHEAKVRRMKRLRDRRRRAELRTQELRRAERSAKYFARRAVHERILKMCDELEVQVWSKGSALGKSAQHHDKKIASVRHTVEALGAQVTRMLQAPAHAAFIEFKSALAQGHEDECIAALNAILRMTEESRSEHDTFYEVQIERWRAVRTQSDKVLARLRNVVGREETYMDKSMVNSAPKTLIEGVVSLAKQGILHPDAGEIGEHCLIAIAANDIDGSLRGLSDLLTLLREKGSPEAMYKFVDATSIQLVKDLDAALEMLERIEQGCVDITSPKFQTPRDVAAAQLAATCRAGLQGVSDIIASDRAQRMQVTLRDQSMRAAVKTMRSVFASAVRADTGDWPTVLKPVLALATAVHDFQDALQRRRGQRDAGHAESWSSMHRDTIAAVTSVRDGIEANNSAAADMSATTLVSSLVALVTDARALGIRYAPDLETGAFSEATTMVYNAVDSRERSVMTRTADALVLVVNTAFQAWNSQEGARNQPGGRKRVLSEWNRDCDDLVALVAQLRAFISAIDKSITVSAVQVIGKSAIELLKELRASSSRTLSMDLHRQLHVVDRIFRFENISASLSSLIVLKKQLEESDSTFYDAHTDRFAYWKAKHDEVLFVLDCMQRLITTASSTTVSISIRSKLEGMATAVRSGKMHQLVGDGLRSIDTQFSSGDVVAGARGIKNLLETVEKVSDQYGPFIRDRGDAWRLAHDQLQDCIADMLSDIDAHDALTRSQTYMRTITSLIHGELNSVQEYNRGLFMLQEAVDSGSARDVSDILGDIAELAHDCVNRFDQFKVVDETQWRSAHSEAADSLKLISDLVIAADSPELGSVTPLSLLARIETIVDEGKDVIHAHDVLISIVHHAHNAVAAGNIDTALASLENVRGGISASMEYLADRIGTGKIDGDDGVDDADGALDSRKVAEKLWIAAHSVAMQKLETLKKLSERAMSSNSAFPSMRSLVEMNLIPLAKFQLHPEMLSCFECLQETLKAVQPETIGKDVTSSRKQVGRAVTNEIGDCLNRLDAHRGCYNDYAVEAEAQWMAARGAALIKVKHIANVVTMSQSTLRAPAPQDQGIDGVRIAGLDPQIVSLKALLSARKLWMDGVQATDVQDAYSKCTQAMSGADVDGSLEGVRGLHAALLRSSASFSDKNNEHKVWNVEHASLMASAYAAEVIARRFSLDEEVLPMQVLASAFTGKAMSQLHPDVVALQARVNAAFNDAADVRSVKKLLRKLGNLCEALKEDYVKERDVRKEQWRKNHEEAFAVLSKIRPLLARSIGSEYPMSVVYLFETLTTVDARAKFAPATSAAIDAMAVQMSAKRQIKPTAAGAVVRDRPVAIVSLDALEAAMEVSLNSFDKVDTSSATAWKKAHVGAALAVKLTVSIVDATRSTSSPISVANRLFELSSACKQRKGGFKFDARAHINTILDRASKSLADGDAVATSDAFREVRVSLEASAKHHFANQAKQQQVWETEHDGVIRALQELAQQIVNAKSTVAAISFGAPAEAEQDADAPIAILNLISTLAKSSVPSVVEEVKRTDAVFKKDFLPDCMDSIKTLKDATGSSLTAFADEEHSQSAAWLEVKVIKFPTFFATDGSLLPPPGGEDDLDDDADDDGYDPSKDLSDDFHTGNDIKIELLIDESGDGVEASDATCNCVTIEARLEGMEPTLLARPLSVDHAKGLAVDAVFHMAVSNKSDPETYYEIKCRVLKVITEDDFITIHNLDSSQEDTDDPTNKSFRNMPIAKARRRARSPGSRRRRRKQTKGGQLGAIGEGDEEDMSSSDEDYDGSDSEDDEEFMPVNVPSETVPIGHSPDGNPIYDQPGAQRRKQLRFKRNKAWKPGMTIAEGNEEENDDEYIITATDGTRFVKPKAGAADVQPVSRAVTVPAGRLASTTTYKRFNADKKVFDYFYKTDDGIFDHDDNPVSHRDAAGMRPYRPTTFRKFNDETGQYEYFYQNADGVFDSNNKRVQGNNPLAGMHRYREPTFSGDAAADDNETDDESIVGYTPDGVPFVLPNGAKMLQPSGFTSDGLPYYESSDILDFQEKTQEREDAQKAATDVEQASLDAEKKELEAEKEEVKKFGDLKFTLSEETVNFVVEGRTSDFLGTGEEDDGFLAFYDKHDGAQREIQVKTVVATLTGTLPFTTEDCKRVLKYRARTSSHLFTVYPQDIDFSTAHRLEVSRSGSLAWTEPKSMSLSMELAVSFTPDDSNVSTLSKGAVTVTSVRGSHITECELSAATGPFIKTTPWNDDGGDDGNGAAVADMRWCKNGEQLEMKFKIENLIGTAVTVALFENQDAASSPEAAAFAVSDLAFDNDDDDNDDYDDGYLDDGAAQNAQRAGMLRLGPNESRFVTFLFVPDREGKFESFFSLVANGIERTEIALNAIGGVPIAFEVFQEQQRASRAAKYWKNVFSSCAIDASSLAKRRERFELRLDDYSKSAISMYSAAMRSLNLKKYNNVDGDPKKKDAKNWLNDVPEKWKAQYAEVRRRDVESRLSARHAKYRPQTQEQSFFQHVQDGDQQVKRKSHYVDFGIYDPVTGGVQARAIQMKNLMDYKVTILVESHSPYFHVEQRFFEVDRKALSHIRVVFVPTPGMDGIVTGELDLFWQDSSHIVFQLQAFIGQPIEFNLTSSAFFPPAMPGQEVRFDALVWNRSPYKVTWHLDPFHKHLISSSTQVMSLETSEVTDKPGAKNAGVSDEEITMAKSMHCLHYPAAGTAGAKMFNACDPNTPVVTNAFASCRLTFVYQVTCPGAIVVPLTIRMLRPTPKRAYQGTRMHEIKLIALGLLPSYALAKHREKMVDPATAISGGIAKKGDAFLPLFGGTTLERDLERLQAFLSLRATTFSQHDAPPLMPDVADYFDIDVRDGLADTLRDRFQLVPNVNTIVNDSDVQKDGKFFLHALQDATESYMILSTSNMVVDRAKGRLGTRQARTHARSLLNSMSAQPTTAGMQNMRAGAGGGDVLKAQERADAQEDRTLHLPVAAAGRMTYMPPEASTLYMTQGFVAAVSLTDGHFSAISVQSHESSKVAVSPSRLDFVKTAVGSQKAGYIVLRSHHLEPCEWLLSLKNNSPMKAFKVPQRRGILAFGQTAIVKIMFLPSSQGAAEDVLMVSMRPTAAPGAVVAGPPTAEAVTIAELPLRGIGNIHSFSGIPQVIDFGNVPIGYMSYAMVDIRNRGFVEDIVHIYSQAPFVASTNYVVIPAKASRRVCLFFRPQRTCVVMRSFMVLAGGQVRRIRCKGTGGSLNFSVESELVTQPRVATSDAARSLSIDSAASTEAAVTTLDFGATLIDCVVRADVFVVNKGTLRAVMQPVMFDAPFRVISSALVVTAEAGLNMLRPSTSTSSGSRPSTTQSRPGTVSKSRPGTRDSSRRGADENGESDKAHGIANESCIIPPGKSLRMHVEFEPAVRLKAYVQEALLKFSEDQPTLPEQVEKPRNRRRASSITVSRSEADSEAEMFVPGEHVRFVKFALLGEGVADVYTRLESMDPSAQSSYGLIDYKRNVSDLERQHSMSAHDRHLEIEETLIELVTNASKRSCEDIVLAMRLAGRCSGALTISPLSLDWGAVAATCFLDPNADADARLLSASDDALVRELVVSNESLETQTLWLDSLKPEVYTIEGLEDRKIDLTPESEIALKVRFEPTKANTEYEGAALFRHKFGRYLVKLAGIGACAEIQLLGDAAEGTVHFPSVKLHSLSTVTIELKNVGRLASNVKIHAPKAPFRIEDMNRQEFSLLSSVIPSGEAFSFVATCLPFNRVKTSYDGDIKVSWQLVPGGHWLDSIVKLSALIGHPKLKISTNDLDFAIVPLNGSITQKIQLSNLGNASLSWNAKVDIADLSVKPTRGSIAAGDTITVAIRFRPSTLDFLNEVVRFLSDGGDVQCTCIGTVIVPQLVIPDELDANFGVAQVKQRQTRSFELYNSGSQPIFYRITMDKQAVGPGLRRSASLRSNDSDDDDEADDALDARQFDRDYDARMASAEAQGYPAPDPESPLIFTAFAVAPWSGVLKPREKVDIELACMPQAIASVHNARLVVNAGFKNAGSFQSVSMRVGRLKCTGGGAHLTKQVHVPAEIYRLWKNDLQVRVEKWTENFIPLGVVRANRMADDNRTLSITNEGNMPGTFSIRPRDAPNALTTAAAAPAAVVRTISSPDEHDLITVRPETWTLNPGQNVFLNFRIFPNQLGLIQREFDLSSPDTDFNHTLTFMLFAATTELTFDANDIDFGVCQTGQKHARNVVLHNTGNMRVSFLLKARWAMSDEDNEMLPQRPCPFRGLSQAKTVDAGSSTTLEIVYDPTKPLPSELENKSADVVYDRAELVVEWLGAPLVLPVRGRMGFGQIQLRFPTTNDAKNRRLDFGDIMFHTTHWKKVTLKNSGTIALEYRIRAEGNGDIKFKDESITAALHTLAIGEVTELEIGVELTETMEFSDMHVCLETSVGDRYIPVRAHGGTFACVVDDIVDFGEVAVKAPMRRTFSYANTGSLAFNLTVTVPVDVRDTVKILSFTTKVKATEKTKTVNLAFVDPSNLPVIYLEPGDVIDLEICCESQETQVIDTAVTLTPNLIGAEPSVVKILVDARAMKLHFDDMSDLAVGKVMLNQSHTLERRLRNPSSKAEVEYSLTLNPVRDCWIVSPMRGVIEPDGEVLIEVTYRSIDTSKSHQHESELSVLNVTTGQTEQVVMCTGGVAFPHLLLTHDDEDKHHFSFGVRMSDRIAYKEFTVENDGTGALTLSIKISSDDEESKSAFGAVQRNDTTKAVTTCHIAENEPYTFLVTFLPEDERVDTAVMEIESSVGKEVVTITGRGSDFHLDCNFYPPDTVDCGILHVGESRAMQLSIANTTADLNFFALSFAEAPMHGLEARFAEIIRLHSPRELSAELIGTAPAVLLSSHAALASDLHTSCEALAASAMPHRDASMIASNGADSRDRVFSLSATSSALAPQTAALGRALTALADAAGKAHVVPPLDVLNGLDASVVTLDMDTTVGVNADGTAVLADLAHFIGADGASRNVYTPLYLHIPAKGTQKLLLKASFQVLSVTCSRSTINFYTTLTNCPVFRRFTLSNPASYSVPFAIVSSHPSTTVEPASGMLAPRSSFEVVVQFLSTVPINTAEPSSTITLSVQTMASVLPPIDVAVHSQCRDFVFDTSLLRGVDFGFVLEGKTARKQLVLRSTVDGDVFYKLAYDERATAAGLRIERSDCDSIVGAGSTKYVEISYQPPVHQPALDAQISVETRAGTFQVAVSGRSAMPRLESSTSRLAFGVVGCEFPVRKTVVLRNSSLIPLNLVGDCRVNFHDGAAEISDCFEFELPTQPIAPGEEFVLHVTFCPTPPSGVTASGETDGDPYDVTYTSDALLLHIRHRDWDDPLTSIAMSGRGGLLRLSLSHDLIDLGELPVRIEKTTVVEVHNDGHAAVTLTMSADDSDRECFNFDSDMGRLMLAVQSLPLTVLPGDTVHVQATVRIDRRGAFSFPFRLSLVGSIVSRAWRCVIEGSGDEVQLSEAMTQVIEVEQLDSCLNVEVEPNPFFRNVLKSIDRVPEVSIHRQLAMVEPCVPPPPLPSNVTALPSAISNSVLHTFKKWYTDRVPLRMTQRQTQAGGRAAARDGWEALEPILRSRVTQVDLSKLDS